MNKLLTTVGAAIVAVCLAAAYAQTPLPDIAFLAPLSQTKESSETTGLPDLRSWALLIAGFGGAGAMLRHRRRETPTRA